MPKDEMWEKERIRRAAAPEIDLRISRAIEQLMGKHIRQLEHDVRQLREELAQVKASMPRE